MRRSPGVWKLQTRAVRRRVPASVARSRSAGARASGSGRFPGPPRPGRESPGPDPRGSPPTSAWGSAGSLAALGSRWPTSPPCPVRKRLGRGPGSPQPVVCSAVQPRAAPSLCFCRRGGRRSRPNAAPTGPGPRIAALSLLPCPPLSLLHKEERKHCDSGCGLCFSLLSSGLRPDSVEGPAHPPQ